MLICECKPVFVGFLIGLVVPWLEFMAIGGQDRLEDLLRKCRNSNNERDSRKFNEYIRSSEVPADIQSSERATTTTKIPQTTDSINNNDDNNDINDINNDMNNISQSWIAGRRVRLLCWFMTDPNILNRMTNVRNTWSKECDVRLFMSSKLNKEFPTVGLDVPSGRSHIAAKSRASWAYVYENYFDQADFFMKADPDSYVVVDNLKLFLASRSPDEPEAYGHALYFGHEAWLGNFSGFYTAGQSVVLSREGLKRLAAGGIDHKYFVDGQAEDLKTIVCLEKRGGYLVDTRDILGRETFMPAYGLSSMLAGHHPSWYTDHYRRYLGYCQATDCLSPFPIVFHYVTTEMYLIDYLVTPSMQLRHRQAFTEEAMERGLLRFNGSILARLAEQQSN